LGLSWSVKRKTLPPSNRGRGLRRDRAIFGLCGGFPSAGQDVTRRTWTRILDPDSAIMCIVAEFEGQVYGLAHCVVHEHTLERQAVCCLQDLYVVPSARGRGIASALIEWLCNAMRAEGWAQLYWVANQDNESAHKLSGRFAAPDRLSRYVIRPR